MKRADVYKLLDEERDYQDKKWGDHKPNLAEWLMYIEDYVNEAKHMLSRSETLYTYDTAKCNIRKIAAMGVCAIEQLDVMSREQEEKNRKSLKKIGIECGCGGSN